MNEEVPGERWQGLFERAWPAYRRWFASEGDDWRPDLELSSSKLREHMPELVPLWERLIELAGDDEEAGRMLALYRPAPYLTGCSQGVWTRGEPFLVRNYDYHPAASEGLFLLSNWHGTRVIAASDCLWGVLDGINEHGLALALSFGGSRNVGDGFGIPLILRYVLEFCSNLEEAVEVLDRIPSHMTYNVSLLDRSGSFGVVYVRPDRAAKLVNERASTNHQERIEWKEYAARTRTTERRRFLNRKATAEDTTPEGFVELFLKPPLYVTDYDHGHGTLYTVVYRPSSGSVDFLWPEYGLSEAFDDFEESEVVVPFATSE